MFTSRILYSRICNERDSWKVKKLCSIIYLLDSFHCIICIYISYFKQNRIVKALKIKLKKLKCLYKICRVSLNETSGFKLLCTNRYWYLQRWVIYGKIHTLTKFKCPHRGLRAGTHLWCCNEHLQKHDGRMDKTESSLRCFPGD